MAIENALGAGSELINNLPTDVSGLIGKLIIILQVAGIVVIIYIIYLIVRGISTWRRNKRIDITYEKVLGIDRKLDELLKRTPRKEKVIEKKEKKPGFFSRLFGFGKRELKKEKKK